MAVGGRSLDRLNSMEASDIIAINRLGVSFCKDGHAPVLHDADKDCPVCKEISKRLTEVNALEVKLALAEQQMTELQGTIESLRSNLDTVAWK